LYKKIQGSAKGKNQEEIIRGTCPQGEAVIYGYLGNSQAEKKQKKKLRIQKRRLSRCSREVSCKPRVTFPKSLLWRGKFGKGPDVEGA